MILYILFCYSGTLLIKLYLVCIFLFVFGLDCADLQDRDTESIQSCCQKEGLYRRCIHLLNDQW